MKDAFYRGTLVSPHRYPNHIQLLNGRRDRLVALVTAKIGEASCLVLKEECGRIRDRLKLRFLVQ